MSTIIKGVKVTARPDKSVTYVPRDDEGFDTARRQPARQEVTRPAHWIPGAGALPADFFLPGVA